MTLALWTLDVGNSSAKLRAWEATSNADGRVSLRRVDGPAALSKSIPLADARAALELALEARTRNNAPLVVALSCVASVALEQELATWLSQRGEVEALVNPDSGLVNEALPPQSVGRDRLYAARGAFERVGSSSIVIDAGSAMTVDLLLVDVGGGRATARFAGGAIAPGPALLARALHEHTARLPLVETRSGASALGRNTTAAIEAGVFHGLRGAARELVQRLASECAGAPLELVITGGAASWLLEPELFVGRSPIHEPDLVHLGLAHAALDARAANSSPRGDA